VHKFGGTSVADAECFRLVAKIVLRNLEANGGGPQSAMPPSRLAVVVSAMGGKPKTTDLLLDSVKRAAVRDPAGVEQLLGTVREKHRKCVSELFQDESQTSQILLSAIETDLHHIQDILKTVSLMKWPAQRILELVSGYGELWSTQILCHLLNRQVRERRQKDSELAGARFAYVDARRVITVDEETGTTIGSSSASNNPAAEPLASSPAGGGVVVWDTSSRKLEQVYLEELDESSSSDSISRQKVHLVMTGYVASNTEGVATTLQRDGSDYSASILGRLLEAYKITIWTDVSGVLTADPRRVPLATVVPEISYNEAQGTNLLRKGSRDVFFLCIVFLSDSKIMLLPHLLSLFSAFNLSDWDASDKSCSATCSELSYFGSKVIHPKTMQPAIQQHPQIPIYIRNTFEPDLPGTRIYLPLVATADNDDTDAQQSQRRSDIPDKVVCGFSTVENMALINVEGYVVVTAGTSRPIWLVCASCARGLCISRGAYSTPWCRST
jgi:aspartokinase